MRLKIFTYTHLPAWSNQFCAYAPYALISFRVQLFLIVLEPVFSNNKNVQK